MDRTIPAGHGDVRIVTDDASLRIDVAGRTLTWPWSAISGAGFARHPLAGQKAPDLPDEIAGVLPGFRSLRSVAENLAETHQALVLAAPSGRPRSFQVFVPAEDPATMAVAAELATRLGDRWQGAGNELDALRQRLGIGYPRWYPLVGTAVALFIGLVTVIPALAGFAAFKDAIGDQSLEPIASIPILSWVAMGIWVVVVGYLVLRFWRVLRTR